MTCRFFSRRAGCLFILWMVSRGTEAFHFDVGPLVDFCFCCFSLTFSASSSFCPFADCPPIRDLVVLNVTSSSFQVSWSLNSTQNCTFQVQVYQAEELLRNASTRGTSLEVAGLEAGVLYAVRTSYQGCWANVTTTVTVKTGKATCLKST